MKDINVLPKSNFPPLLSLTYVLQHSSDELLNKEAGISLSQTRIMSALGAMPVSQRAVAVSLHQTEANVSRQLQLMKKHGLVSITKNKKDGRQRDVILTAKGRRKHQKAKEVLRHFERSIASKEASAIRLAAQTLTDNL